jgi:hypothetical protein
MENLKLKSIFEVIISVFALLGWIFIIASLFISNRQIKFLLEMFFYTFFPIYIAYMLPEKWFGAKDKIIFGCIKRLFQGTLFLGCIYLLIVILVPMYIDVPNAIFSKFSCVEEKPYNLRVTAGRNPEQYFTINNIEFSVDRYDFSLIDRNKKYKVTYLPNCRYVINIEQSD